MFKDCSLRLVCFLDPINYSYQVLLSLNSELKPWASYCASIINFIRRTLWRCGSSLLVSTPQIRWIHNLRDCFVHYFLCSGKRRFRWSEVCLILGTDGGQTDRLLVVFRIGLVFLLWKETWCFYYKYETDVFCLCFRNKHVFGYFWFFLTFVPYKYLNFLNKLLRFKVVDDE